MKYELHAEHESTEDRLISKITAKNLLIAKMISMDIVKKFDKAYENDTLDTYTGVIQEGDDIVLTCLDTGNACFLVGDEWENVDMDSVTKVVENKTKTGR